MFSLEWFTADWILAFNWNYCLGMRTSFPQEDPLKLVTLYSFQISKTSYPCSYLLATSMSEFLGYNLAGTQFGKDTNTNSHL